MMSLTQLCLLNLIIFLLKSSDFQTLNLLFSLENAVRKDPFFKIQSQINVFISFKIEYSLPFLKNEDN